MNLRSLLIVLVFGGATLAASRSSCAAETEALRLVGKLGDQPVTRVTVADGKIVITDASGTHEAPPNVRWRLDGNLRSQPELICFNPVYRIISIPREAGASSDTWRREAIVSVHATSLWNPRKAKNPILVFAWLVDGRLTDVVPVAAYATPLKPDYISGFARFELYDAIARGSPVVLVWADGKFLPVPQPYRDPGMLRAVAEMHIGSEDEFNAAAKAIRSPNAAGTDAVKLLHIAAQNGRLQALEHLLELGARPNVTDVAGETPLHRAADKGRLEAVQLLLAKGAQPAPLNRANVTPLRQAIFAGHLDSACLLIDQASQEERRDLIFLAIEQGDTHRVEGLLATGKDSDLQEIPASALYAAVEQRDAQLLTLLLHHGVKPDTLVFGVPWVSVAADADAGECVEVLLAAGAPASQTDDRGRTSLMYAMRRGSPELVERLLRAGVDGDAADRDGATALHFGAAAGRLDFVEMMLAHGARATAVDGTGRSPLVIALTAHNRAIAAALAAKGARLNPKSATFASDLEQAIALDLPELVAAATADAGNSSLVLHGRWPLASVAEICGASGVVAWAHAQDSAAAAPAAPEIVAHPDQPAKPTSGTRPEDPRPSDTPAPAMTFQISILVDVDGTAMFPRLLSDAACDVMPSVQQVLPTWRFVPARSNGDPAPSLLRLSLSFPEREGRVFESTEPDVLPASKEPVPIALTREESRYTIARMPRTADDFGRQPILLYTSDTTFRDQIITASTRPLPRLDEELIVNSVYRDEWAIIEFVVNLDGRPGDLRILSWRRWEFGQRAAAAVSGMRFTPASHAGHAVRARMALAVQPTS